MKYFLKKFTIPVIIFSGIFFFSIVHISFGADAATICTGVRGDNSAIQICETNYNTCIANHPGIPNTNNCAQDAQQIGTGYAAYTQCVNGGGTDDSCHHLLAPASESDYISTFDYSCEAGQTWFGTGGEQGGCVSTTVNAPPPPPPSSTNNQTQQNCGTNCNLGYTPLEPLPGGITKLSNSNFGQYISSIFKIAILFGGLLAVIMMVWGGIQYMVSEVAGTKNAAKKRIFAAVYGLLLLLGSYLILNTINPQLVSFNTLFTPTPGGAQTGGGIPTSAGGDLPLPPPPPPQGAIPPTNAQGSTGYTGDCTGPLDIGPGTCQDTQCRAKGGSCSLEADITGWNCYCG